MPKFENPTQSFEKDKLPEEPEKEQESEKSEELEEAINSQQEELKKEADKKSTRFKGAGGFLGKAAVIISSIFSGAGESESAEPKEKPEKPAAEYVDPYKYPGATKGKYEIIPPSAYSGTIPGSYSYGPGSRGSGFGEKQKKEVIVTSKSLSDLFNGRKVKNLGGNNFAIHRGGNKYLQIDKSCLEKILEIQRNYTSQYGRRRFNLRAEATEQMEKDLNDLIKREGKEIEIEEKVPVSKPVEKSVSPEKSSVKPSKKSTRITKDYYKDSGTYSGYRPK